MCKTKFFIRAFTLSLFASTNVLALPLNEGIVNSKFNASRYLELPADWSNEGLLAKGYCLKIANGVTPHKEIIADINEALNYEYTSEWTQGAVKKMKEWGCFK
tara:strand:+ start:152 stop:460 length:309 start_codon:yes stop_codon:yes gene_type:complete